MQRAIAVNARYGPWRIGQTLRLRGHSDELTDGVTHGQQIPTGFQDSVGHAYLGFLHV